jgi:hypothetical protein
MVVMSVVASMGVFIALPGSALGALSWSPAASVDAGNSLGSTAVFKTQGRTITEIGIANKTLDSGRRRRAALLKGFT